MTTETKHTQGEWKFVTTKEKDLRIASLQKDGRYSLAIATVHSLKDETIANAKHICNAVNMHDKLVECLKDLIDAYPSGRYRKVRDLLKQAEQK